jgi:uncharacterized protein (TIGR00730 family)
MNVCVFCGSSTGFIPDYKKAAKDFGILMAKNQFTLIYGGGNVGLMGILADAVMEEGGKVIGVIPDFLLKREVGHRGITELEIVESMHQRKKRMADLADAFVALPGGCGTLEELAEVLTWRQLNLIRQPVAVLNVRGFFDPLLSQMRHMATEGFLKPDFLSVLKVFPDGESLLSGISIRSQS